MAVGQMRFEPKEYELSELLQEIEEGGLQLPEFQRSWVWDLERVRELVASVSQGWPIGAILLLQTGGEVRFKPRKVEGAPDPVSSPNRLILDGQQRLTSLYQALRSDKPLRTEDTRHRTVERLLYFNIAACVDAEEDRADAVIDVPVDRIIREDFGRVIKFDLSTVEKEYAAAHIPVAVAFDSQRCREWRRGFSLFHNRSQDDVYDEFERAVIDVIQSYRVPGIVLGRNTSRAAVCTVFEKVNTGGKPLDVFELVTAMYAADGHDLRIDWTERAKKLHEWEVLREVKATDFLQAVTLLTTYVNRAGGGRVGCKREDMLRLELSDWRRHADAIQQGFLRCARLLVREHIFEPKFMPYDSQLIPLAAIAAALGNRFEDDAVKARVLRWYWCGVMGELYGGSTESRFALDIQQVVAWMDGGDEPRTVQDCNFFPLRLLTLRTRNSAAYKGLMALMIRQGAADFLRGDPIDLTRYFRERVDIHHVFPQAWYGKNGISDDLGNSIVNKTPLAADTNQIIGGVAPSVYLGRIERQHQMERSRLDDLLETHLIPAEFLRADDFHGFVRARARRLLDAIERATGRPVAGRASDEVAKAFGGPLPPWPARTQTRKLFENYDVVEELPRGGMSEAFKVRAPDGTLMFMKRVPTQGYDASALLREQQVYTRLQRAECPGVLQVHGFERDETHAALLLELAEGGSLADFVSSHANGRLATRDAKAVAQEVLDALRSLHGLDIVHRDLKPDNVFRVHGRWKLGDFGIAKNLTRPITQMTFRQAGTPGYAPPEQFDGAEATASADVYAFGKLLTFIVSGDTDPDKVTYPSWGRLIRACTRPEPDQRPGLDEVETLLTALQV